MVYLSVLSLITFQIFLRLGKKNLVLKITVDIFKYRGLKNVYGPNLSHIIGIISA